MPDNPSYLTDSWMDLRWSAWMPLMAAHPLALAQLPSQPGIYRLRRVDQPCRLVWIGWAGRGVREAVERLSRQIHLPVEPYDDPHGPATILWSLRRTAKAAFEVSGAPLQVPDEEGKRRARILQRAYEGERDPAVPPDTPL